MRKRYSSNMRTAASQNYLRMQTAQSFKQRAIPLNILNGGTRVIQWITNQTRYCTNSHEVGYFIFSWHGKHIFLSSFRQLDHFDHHVVLRNITLEFYKNNNKNNNKTKKTKKKTKKKKQQQTNKQNNNNNKKKKIKNKQTKKKNKKKKKKQKKKKQTNKKKKKKKNNKQTNIHLGGWFKTIYNQYIRDILKHIPLTLYSK